MCNSAPPTETVGHARRIERVLACAALLTVFALHAGWQVPDVNEAHYLTKARHYWDPAWIPNDFFLNSADSHEVFYFSIGWLGQGLSLESFAWAGRLLTWGLLAVTFERLARALWLNGLQSVVAGALFVALNSRYSMAGEWVVGGFEAKGLAYAAVLWGLERWIRGRWNQALLAMGGAAALHVLVGGWSAIALGFAWIALGSDRPSLRTLWPGLLSAAVIAIPPFLSALFLNSGEPSKTVTLANHIYVHLRLPHHLLPRQFDHEAVLRMLAVGIAWGLLGRRLPAEPAIRRLRGFVNGAIAIALLGFVIYFCVRSNDALTASVMRYYWFRLADVALPLGVALLSIRWVESMRPIPWARIAAGGAIVIVAAWSLGDDVKGHVRLRRPPADAPPKIVDFSDWRDVCHWAATQTPTDAVFITPRFAQTFKWHAERGEVVNLKDIPQDAHSIVDWWQRLASIHRVLSPSGERVWLDSLAMQSPERLRELAGYYSADYLIVERQPSLALEQIYSNNSYAVYRLRGK